MNAVITLTKEEADAIKMAICDADYWGRQMRNSDNFRDADTYYKRAEVLQRLLDNSNIED